MEEISFFSLFLDKDLKLESIFGVGLYGGKRVGGVRPKEFEYNFI